jgi:hypothetical protein
MVTVIFAAYAVGVIATSAPAGQLSDWYGESVPEPVGRQGPRPRGADLFGREHREGGP